MDFCVLEAFTMISFLLEAFAMDFFYHVFIMNNIVFQEEVYSIVFFCIGSVYHRHFLLEVFTMVIVPCYGMISLGREVVWPHDRQRECWAPGVLVR